jgi:hypothetical protein
LKHVGIDYIGRRIVGTEYIDYDEENDNLRSYFFSNQGSFGRVALEYVREVGDDTFTIWSEEVGSPVSFKGRFSNDHNHYLRGLRVAGRRARGNYNQSQVTKED